MLKVHRCTTASSVEEACNDALASVVMIATAKRIKIGMYDEADIRARISSYLCSISGSYRLCSNWYVSLLGKHRADSRCSRALAA